ILQGEIFLADPCVDNGRIMDHVGCGGDILLHRHQLDGAPNFTQCFLFPAEAGINQGKNAKWGTKLGLLLHNFFLLGANRFESGARFCFVFQHPCEQTTAEPSTELHLVVAKGGVSKCTEGSVRSGGITLCQSAEEPDIGDAPNSLWILAANLINRLMQGTSISFPVEEG